MQCFPSLLAFFGFVLQFSLKCCSWSSMVAHTFSRSTFQWQYNHCEFQDSQCYIVRPSLKTKQIKEVADNKNASFLGVNFFSSTEIFLNGKSYDIWNLLQSKNNEKWCQTNQELVIVEARIVLDTCACIFLFFPLLYTVEILYYIDFRARGCCALRISIRRTEI